MSLLARINLWLCVSFVCFLAAAVLLSRAAMRDEARDDAIAVAQLLMDSAQAARDYTATEIEPMVTSLSQDKARPAAGANANPQPFRPQIIPAYAATQIFEALRHKRPEYAYREATLNPTNLRDRAVDWEMDLIQHFRADPKADEIVKDRPTELGRSLYLAKPIRIDDGECLVCHDTAAAAPPDLLHQYGSANGFGWKLHETVGARIVSVPLAAALAGADRVVLIVSGVLTALFILMFVVVNLVVRAVVLRPIAKLASAAESISVGRPVNVDLNVPGRDEISALCRAFDRMKTSIDKSLALLQRPR
jgi:protein-histidine pros-kinase